MEIMQLLGASVGLTHFGKTYDVALDWIGRIIEWLISGIGIVGVGIIVFSLILKLIVLPFDVYQRISMRKQNNKMQENQERMEKLQKQYANNKDMYNQKVMEMYRENGISMFSSCLPLILSMVVFFAAIGGFNKYSQYANIQNYNAFINAYNEKIESYAPEATDSTLSYNASTGMFTVDSDENTVYYTVKAKEDASAWTKEQQLSYVKSVLEYKEKDADGKLIFASYMAKIDETIEKYGIEVTGAKDEAVTNYYVSQAQDAVKAEYEANSFDRVGFLWVKNIWNVDASYEHPLTPHDKMMTPVKNLFSSENKFDVNGRETSFGDMQAYENSPYKAAAYNTITEKLSDAKSAPNGYFILIALSIGTILLQQFISMRSQKAQNKYSSVDGQQAMTQKTTMVIMTIMFGIFSFLYSAAFSIYMVVSSIFSLGSTVVINKMVDAAMSKKEAEAMKAKYTRKLPGQKDEEPKKKKHTK